VDRGAIASPVHFRTNVSLKENAVRRFPTVDVRLDSSGWSSRRTQPGQRDQDQAADGHLGGQAAGRREGAKAVERQLICGYVSPEVAAPGVLDKLAAEELVDAPPRPGYVLPWCRSAARSVRWARRSSNWMSVCFKPKGSTPSGQRELRELRGQKNF
jgi:hypothetical protein